MTQAVYVVERVVLQVSADDGYPAEFFEAEGDNGGQPSRVPVAAFRHRADADALVERLTAEARDEISPARVYGYPDESAEAAVRAALRAHGFVWADDPGGDSVSFLDWWAAHGPDLPPEAVRAVWEVVGRTSPLYRVELRELEE